MVTIPDINRNLSGKWYGYGNYACSAWLSCEGCTEEEKVKGFDNRKEKSRDVNRLLKFKVERDADQTEI